MVNKRTLIVNFFGAPGSGKSTAAAYIFAKLKMAGINAELVTEFAKDKTWENNKLALSDQFYVFGEQNFRLSRLNGQVDVVLTDSPLLLSNYYAGVSPQMFNFKKACLDVFNTHKNLNFFLQRVKEYNPSGRSQTEEESDEIAKELVSMLNGYDVIFSVYRGCVEDYDKIFEVILEKLQK